MENPGVVGAPLKGAPPVTETNRETAHEGQRSEVGINEIFERKGSLQQEQTYLRLFSDSNKPKEDVPAQHQWNSVELEESQEEHTEVNLNKKKIRKNLIVSELCASSAAAFESPQENGKFEENMEQCRHPQGQEGQKEQEGQVQVSVPEWAEEREEESTRTDSSHLLLDQSRSCTDVRENAQGKGGTEKQGEQGLPSPDYNDQATTDCDAGDTNERGKQWTIAPGIVILLAVTFGCYLMCQAAPPLTITSKVQGNGRPEQGLSYNLTCETVGHPDFGATLPHVWYKNEKALRNEKEHVLLFPKLNQSNSGKYECEPELPDKRGSLLREPFQLKVWVFQNMTLVPEMETEVEEGETVLINCSLNSVPPAQLVWTMEGKILRRVESNFDSLVLHNASQFHLKVVYCQATNRKFFMQFKEKYTQIRIKGTFEIMSRPQIRTDDLPVLGRPFRLSCRVLDLPPNHVNINLTFLWYKDSVEIPGQYGRVFLILSLAREDGGKYECRARNGKPQTTSPSSDDFEVLVLLPSRVSVEPEPSTPDAVIKRAAGEELILRCIVREAFPPVPHDGYRWSYLPSSQGPPRTLEIRENTLLLGPLTKNHGGKYTCQARNDVDIFEGQIPPGNATVTVDVVYLGKITSTPDLKVSKGERVALTCAVESNPTARLAWVVDGEEVRHMLYNVDHYVLENAACSDSKTYTCLATNPDLPGLERNASINVRVNCSRDGENASGPNSSSLPWLSLLLLVPILATILVCCYKKYCKEAEPRRPEDAPLAAAQGRPGQ